MKCPSCSTTISGVYEAGDYACSGCSAQLRVNPVTRTKSKPKQRPHTRAQKRARKTARAGSWSGDESGAYPSFKMRRDNPEGAHNRKFLAAASELGQTYGEIATSTGRGRGKSALAKDLRAMMAKELAGLEARLAKEEEKLERQEFSSARNAREHDKIRGKLIDRIDALILAMREQRNPGYYDDNPTTRADYSGYKPISGHTSEETAYIVDDYPYGFRLRTQIRYWVETKKGKGQRFVSQTLNPKTSRWNKPKASIYSTVVMMALNEEDHVVNVTMSEWASGEEIEDFAMWAEGHLNEWQTGALDYLRAVRRAGERTTWTTHVCPGPDCPEHHQTREEQADMFGQMVSEEMRRPRSTDNPGRASHLMKAKGWANAKALSKNKGTEYDDSMADRQHGAMVDEIYSATTSLPGDGTLEWNDMTHARLEDEVNQVYRRGRKENRWIANQNPSWRNPQQLSFGEEETRIATRTARGAGVVGATAVVPRWVGENVPKSKKILDFGSGPPARHTMALREKGYTNVTAHEFGDNVQKGVHDPKALSKKYDVVFASNVLNVQSSEAMLKRTLKQICGSVKKDGLAVFNYPKEPRKAGLKVATVAGAIAEVFPGAVERVSQGSEAPMWTAKRS